MAFHENAKANTQAQGHEAQQQLDDGIPHMQCNAMQCNAMGGTCALAQLATSPSSGEPLPGFSTVTSSMPSSTAVTVVAA